MSTVVTAKDVAKVMKAHAPRHAGHARLAAVINGVDRRIVQADMRRDRKAGGK